MSTFFKLCAINVLSMGAADRERIKNTKNDAISIVKNIILIRYSIVWDCKQIAWAIYTLNNVRI